ncbi:MAG TPA: hypothetical protein DCQ64_22320 [Candidatus Rokubacteria bacterium]|nr:hypothetical protein [Candidatus Rokubacteria bacterium]
MKGRAQAVVGDVAGAKVQDVALNGAQMTALQGIVQSVSDGLLPVDSARQIIYLSVPSAPSSLVDEMVEAAAKQAQNISASRNAGGNPAARGGTSDGTSLVAG